MSNTKTIGGWLVVDWRDETHRTRKNKPSSTELGTNELLAELQVDVTVPDVEVPTLAVEIDVPEPQVHAATLEALDDEDLPDWTDTANEVVNDHATAIQDTTSQQESRELVDQLTTRTLVNVSTRPDPQKVRKYVRQMVHRVGNGNKAGEPTNAELADTE